MIIQALRLFFLSIPVIVTVIVILFLTIWWWIEESRPSPTCVLARPGVTTVPQMRGYVELALRKQDPVEPEVESDFYLRLEKPPVSPPQKVTVWRSAVGH